MTCSIALNIYVIFIIFVAGVVIGAIFFEAEPR